MIIDIIFIVLLVIVCILLLIEVVKENDNRKRIRVLEIENEILRAKIKRLKYSDESIENLDVALTKTMYQVSENSKMLVTLANEVNESKTESIEEFANKDGKVL